MTSLRQLLANRRNAERSTGPKTEGGRRRSRRNALRHGLCAETVIEALEDVDDYKAFELAITLDYDAQTAVERELVLRLASLLWRVRRATAIGTDLLRLCAEGTRGNVRASAAPDGPPAEPECPLQSRANADGQYDRHEDPSHADDFGDPPTPPCRRSIRRLADCFVELGELAPDAFDRIGRYEAALWRQIVQTLLALRSARRHLGPALRNGWWRKGSA